VNVTFRCPACDATSRVEVADEAREVACPTCQAKFPILDGALAKGRLYRCLVCPSTELYIRKDFSQRLGVAIVVVGFVISSIFWYYRLPLWTYGVLFATALIDVVLYLFVGNVLHCYRCHAQYRGLAELENHGGFDLETHEKHRQQLIRLAEAEKAHKPTA
jgi:DNA-directed RNA polymerase subunit RPC12/RpoP